MTELEAKDNRLGQGEQGPASGERPEWREVGPLLGVDLDASARAHKVIQRRREVASGLDALLLALRYAALDWSISLVGAYASVKGISGTACRQQLRKMDLWLETLTRHTLHKLLDNPGEPGLAVELVDASVICQPGSQGIDWRLHLEYNVGTGQMSRIRLTDVRGGESFKHLSLRPKQLVIGDRGYCSRPGLKHVLDSGVHFLVRWNSGNLPLRDQAGADLDMAAHLRQLRTTLEPGQIQEIPAALKLGKADPSSPAVRVIFKRLDPEVAERARRRVRKAARKEHHCPAELSLLCGDFLILITDLNPWPAELLTELYRARWQIELLFKQLKSLAHLDRLRVKDPVLVRVYLFAKLLAWLIGQLAVQSQLSPAPAHLPDHPARTLSFWRLADLIWQATRALITPVLCLSPHLFTGPRLRRHLYPPPRTRPRQSSAIQTRIAKMA